MRIPTSKLSASSAITAMTRRTDGPGYTGGPCDWRSATSSSRPRRCRSTVPGAVPPGRECAPGRRRAARRRRSPLPPRPSRRRRTNRHSGAPRRHQERRRAAEGRGESGAPLERRSTRLPGAPPPPSGAPADLILDPDGRVDRRHLEERRPELPLGVLRTGLLLVVQVAPGEPDAARGRPGAPHRPRAARPGGRRKSRAHPDQLALAL